MKRKIAEAILKKQFDRAEALGWLPHVEDAAKANGLPAALLLAIGSRETNLDPRYLKGPGDGGHGYGLTQADIRSFPGWVRAERWKDPRACFFFAAEVYKRDEALIHSWEGKTINGRFRSGTPFAFTARPLSDLELNAVTIAGYNCGPASAYYHLSMGRSPDTGTTGADYSADVMARAAVFAKLLQERELAAVPAPVVKPAPVAKLEDAPNARPDVVYTDDHKPEAPGGIVGQIAEHPSAAMGALKFALKRAGQWIVGAGMALQGFVSSLSTAQKISLVVAIGASVAAVYLARHQIKTRSIALKNLIVRYALK